MQDTIANCSDSFHEWWNRLGKPVIERVTKMTAVFPPWTARFSRGGSVASMSSGKSAKASQKMTATKRETTASLSKSQD